jgi:ArsR family transcriptional regulator, arsenate/arsenite/antimonite-responsive transcriptional repressor
MKLSHRRCYQYFMKRRISGPEPTKTSKDVAVGALAALAHEYRLRIFRLLVKRGASGMRTSEIATQVDVSPTNLSFHLTELGRAGLLRRNRDGRYARYTVDVEAVRRLLTYLAEDCCLSDASLVARLSETRSAA